jgi:hypothetical protein
MANATHYIYSPEKAALLFWLIGVLDKGTIQAVAGEI